MFGDKILNALEDRIMADVEAPMLCATVGGLSETYSAYLRQQHIPYEFQVRFWNGIRQLNNPALDGIDIGQSILIVEETLKRAIDLRSRQPGASYDIAVDRELIEIAEALPARLQERTPKERTRYINSLLRTVQNKETIPSREYIRDIHLIVCPRKS